MKEILMITEEPNHAATQLLHDNLFDINLNPFCQFFGRILFGSEKSFRNCFKPNLIHWMHAKGSNCHGKSTNDGKQAILEYINKNENNLRLIVCFGIPASRVLLPYKQANFATISNKFSNGIIDLSNILNRTQIQIPVAIFPHVSGRATRAWITYANFFSKLAEIVQDKSINICNTYD